MKRLFLILISCTLLTCSGCITAESNDKLERQLNQAKAQLAKEKASVAQLKTEVLRAEKIKREREKTQTWIDVIELTGDIVETIF